MLSTLSTRKCSIRSRSRSFLLGDSRSFDRLEHSLFNRSLSASTLCAILRNSSRLVSFAAFQFGLVVLFTTLRRSTCKTGTLVWLVLQALRNRFVFSLLVHFLRKSCCSIAHVTYLRAAFLFFHRHILVQVAQVARTFRVFFSKAKTGDGPEDYLVDHRPVLIFLWRRPDCHFHNCFCSIIMYLMNPNGVSHLVTLVIKSFTIFCAGLNHFFSARWLIARRSLYRTTAKTLRRRNLLPKFCLLLMISKKHDNRRCKVRFQMQTKFHKALPILFCCSLHLSCWNRNIVGTQNIMAMQARNFLGFRDGIYSAIGILKRYVTRCQAVTGQATADEQPNTGVTSNPKRCNSMTLHRTFIGSERWNWKEELKVYAKIIWGKWSLFLYVKFGICKTRCHQSSRCNDKRGHGSIH